MALIKCKECGGKISDKAKTCPHCGFPLEYSHKSSITDEHRRKLEYDNVLLLVSKMISDFKKVWGIRLPLDASCIISLYDDKDIVTHQIEIIFYDSKNGGLNSHHQVKYNERILDLLKICEFVSPDIVSRNPHKLTFEMKFSQEDGVFSHSCHYADDGTYLFGDEPLDSEAFANKLQEFLSTQSDIHHNGLKTILQIVNDIAHDSQLNENYDAYLTIPTFQINKKYYPGTYSLQFLGTHEDSQERGFIVVFRISENNERIFKQKFLPVFPEFKPNFYKTSKIVTTGRKVIENNLSGQMVIDDEYQRDFDRHNYYIAELGFDIDRVAEIFNCFINEFVKIDSLYFWLIFTKKRRKQDEIPSFVYATMNTPYSYTKGKCSVVTYDRNGAFVSSVGFIRTKEIREELYNEGKNIHEEEAKEREEFDSQMRQWKNRVYKDSALFALFLAPFITPIVYAFIWMTIKSPFVTDNWVSTMVLIFVPVFIALFIFKRNELS